jgi:hypothetical protein
MGLNVCLLSEPKKGCPEKDLVCFCFGKLKKNGLPKHRYLMTPDEASNLGEALIGARWLYMERLAKKP